LQQHPPKIDQHYYQVLFDPSEFFGQENIKMNLRIGKGGE
jgi:hypothetical protein